MFSSRQQDTVGAMPFDRFVTTYSNDYKPPMHDPHRWVTQMTLRAAPAAFSLPQTVGTNWERFVTTYRNDYKPFSERHPQVSQVTLRADAAAETKHETSPTCLNHFYKTNGTNGSSGLSQGPPCPLFSGFLPALGSFPPCVHHVSSQTENGKQEAGVNLETRALLSKEDDAVLKEQKAKPDKKFDILLDETVAVTCPACPACCKYFVRCECREAGQQDLLHLPMASAPCVAQNWTNSNDLKGLNPVSSTIPQPTTTSCTCFPQEVVRPYRDCTQFQTPPSESKPTPSQVQASAYSRVPSRNPWVTEYQASYSAVYL